MKIIEDCSVFRSIFIFIFFTKFCVYLAGGSSKKKKHLIYIWNIIKPKGWKIKDCFSCTDLHNWLNKWCFLRCDPLLLTSFLKVPKSRSISCSTPVQNSFPEPSQTMAAFLGLSDIWKMLQCPFDWIYSKGLQRGSRSLRGAVVVW